MPSEGAWLTKEEEAELSAYQERGVAPPDKYQDVIYDSTRAEGGGHRYKTSGEKKAEEEQAKTAKATADAYAKTAEKVDKDVAAAAAQPTTRAPVQDVDAAGQAVTSTPPTSTSSSSSGSSSSSSSGR